MPFTSGRYLIAIASKETDGGANPLVTLKAIAHAYYAFHECDAEVMLASRSGGSPNLSLLARDIDRRDPCVARFLSDRAARDELAETVALKEVAAEDFAGTLFVGFSGSPWSEENRDLGELARKLLKHHKPMAFIPGDRVDIGSSVAEDRELVIAGGTDSVSQIVRRLLEIVKPHAKSTG